MALRYVCYLLLFIVTLCMSTASAAEIPNERPIIGILTQEVSNMIKRIYKEENYNSYIAASYVKFVEGAGARVVPIWINKSRSYYEDILSKINGVLLPGGSTFFNQTAGYSDAGEHIFEIAKRMNDDGDFMPIWGTCLGFELLIYLEANQVDYRTYCSSHSQALPLEFKPGYEESRMFKPATANIISNFKNDNVTINFHMYCYTPETFAENKLENSWRVMSVNHDLNGIPFISSVEHKKYPFYGVQFHPEKVLYEFVTNKNIPHFGTAVEASQYLSNFFISETRKNIHFFKDVSEEESELIYNYSPKYTGTHGSIFVQQYLFKRDPELSQRSSSSVQTATLFLILAICMLNII